MADRMMRPVFITICLSPFCVASALASSQTLPALPPGTSPLKERAGDGFHDYTYHARQAVVVAGTVNDTLSSFSPREAGVCSGPGLVPHPAVSARINTRRELSWPLLVEAACAHYVPVDLMDAVVLAESRYQVFATSPAGAVGLAQLMPETARAL